jgi:hypothetical protein
LTPLAQVAAQQAGEERDKPPDEQVAQGESAAQQQTDDDSDGSRDAGLKDGLDLPRLAGPGAALVIQGWLATGGGNPLRAKKCWLAGICCVERRLVSG